jgi:hypothetical protein
MFSITQSFIAGAAVFTLCAPAFSADTTHMEIVAGKDITGEVFKRLGLPNQDYCWEQCLKEDRCQATRWGFLEGATAGQCQFLTGALTFSEPKEIKTGDGQKIFVTVSRKVISSAPAGI